MKFYGAAHKVGSKDGARKNVVKFTHDFIMDNGWIVESMVEIFPDLTDAVLERLIGNIRLLDIDDYDETDILSFMLTHYHSDGGFQC